MKKSQHTITSNHVLYLYVKNYFYLVCLSYLTIFNFKLHKQIKDKISIKRKALHKKINEFYGCKKSKLTVQYVLPLKTKTIFSNKMVFIISTIVLKD